MRSTRPLRRELKQRRMAFLKGGEVVRFVVRTALDPAAEQDANPLEGQGSERGVAGGALGTMLPRPEGLATRTSPTLSASRWSLDSPGFGARS